MSQITATREAVAEILRGLEAMHAEAQKTRPKWSSCSARVSHPDLLDLLQQLKQGAAFPAAILISIASPTGVLAAVFFGPMATAAEFTAADATADASDGERRLCIVLSALPADPEALAQIAGRHATTSVIVATDLTRYQFFHSTSGKPRPEPFIEADIDELTAEIVLTGSVWSSVFPAHRAIITRTTAVSVPPGERSILFDNRAGAFRSWISASRLGMSREERREFRALDRLRSAFCCGDGLALLSLEDLRRRFQYSGDPVETIAARRTGDLVTRTFRPPRSKVVTFDPNSPAPEPKRGDYVLSYQPGGTGAEYFREFVMSVEGWTAEERELYRTALDMLHVLAIRRSGLFRLGFAERVYTVLLPPALLTTGNEPDRGIVVVSCIILYQVPRKSCFRRTFTISQIAIPVELDPVLDDDNPPPMLSRIMGPRVTGIEDLRVLRRDLKAQTVPGHDSPQVTVHGPLSVLLGLGDEATTLPTLCQQIGDFVCGKVIADRRSDESSVPEYMNLTATIESSLSTLLLQVDWQTPSGAAQPWEDWLITGKDAPFTDNVYKLMFYEDFIDPRCGYTSKRGMDFERMLVGNSLRTDMNGMTFFDPTDELKLILYPLHRESYPNYSIVRWMAFSLYSESALCSLQGMIQRFYVDLHRQIDLRSVVETLGEMTESFAELYDLDIRRHLYRQEYERLRELIKVDRDYSFLLQKFESVKEDASLREQRLFNKLLVAFTVATTSVAITATVAQILGWTAKHFLKITIPSAVGLTVAGYLAFDRIRRLLSRGE